MTFFLTYFLVPFITLMLPGNTNWFTSNFSVAAAEYPQNILLLLWAGITTQTYRMSFKQTTCQTAPFFLAKTERLLADCSAYLLLIAVCLPYRPEKNPFISSLHVLLAFSSTVIFYLAITIYALKLYAISPDLFSIPVCLLIFAIAVSISLLILCDFLISSILEIFLTLFACLWLNFLHGRVKQLSKSRNL